MQALCGQNAYILVPNARQLKPHCDTQKCNYGFSTGVNRYCYF